MFKEAMKLDSKFRKRVNFIYLPISIFCLILLLCFAICMGTVNNKMNTIHYISAELVEATVFSFENDESFKLLELDDKFYNVRVESIPPHLENGDKISVAMDKDGHILGKENYKIDEKIYIDGLGIDIPENSKELSYQEYLDFKLIEKDLPITFTGFIMFILLDIAAMFFLLYKIDKDYKVVRKKTSILPTDNNITNL